MESKTETRQFLTFELADELYGIEVRSIREILELQRITRIPQSEEYLLGVMNVRGRVVPVVDLRIKFGLAPIETTVENAIIVLEVATEGRDSLIGVLVDTVDQVIEISTDEIQPAPQVGTTVDGQLLSGMGKQDERFILLIKTENLFTERDIDSLTATEQAAADETQAAPVPAQ